MSDQPRDETLLDPADFVGEPPAGDARLDDFVSNDQSTINDGSADPGGAATEDSSEDES